MLASPALDHSCELAVAKTAVRLASKLCTRAQLQLQHLNQQRVSTERLVTTTVLGCQALLALVLQQGLPDETLRLVAARDFALLRAPQSASIAKSIQEEVSTVLSGEPGYRAATDAEFADLIWTGLSQGGSKGCYWIVNPIDSLEGFENLRQYGISLSLLDNGKVVLAALACPNLPVAPILATEKVEEYRDDNGKVTTRRTVEEPASVYRPLEQPEAQHSIGCLFTAMQGQGAFQADLFANDADGAQSDHIRLPTRQFFPQERRLWARPFQQPEDGTFALVTSHQSKFQAPGIKFTLARQPAYRPTSCLALDGQAPYGALARGDAKVLVMGGQDDIWDHAAGVLIAQEAGLLVTNGAGAMLDTSCGTKLNTDRGILATPPDWHADVVECISQSISREAHMQWVEAVIDSGVVTPLALQAIADNYECANYHEFVPKLRDAAVRSKLKLSNTCGQQLLRIFSQGSAAIKLALSQRSITYAEICCMLQLSPEAAAGLTDRSLGLTAETHGEEVGRVDTSEEEIEEEEGDMPRKRQCCETKHA